MNYSWNEILEELAQLEKILSADLSIYPDKQRIANYNDEHTTEQDWNGSHYEI